MGAGDQLCMGNGEIGRACCQHPCHVDDGYGQAANGSRIAILQRHTCRLEEQGRTREGECQAS